MPAERRGDDDGGAADASAGEFVTPPEPPEQSGETRISEQPGGETRISQQPDQTRISEQPGGETRISQQPDRTRIAEQPAFATPAAGEPVVEGEAVELPPEPAAAPHDPAPPTVERPQPSTLAEEPVAVASPGPAPDPVTPLGDVGAAHASGHAASSGPSWQEPVMKVANERPELVVAAAFAGGLLVAMILRRLGN